MMNGSSGYVNNAGMINTQKEEAAARELGEKITKGEIRTLSGVTEYMKEAGRTATRWRPY